MSSRAQPRNRNPLLLRIVSSSAFGLFAMTFQAHAGGDAVDPVPILARIEERMSGIKTISASFTQEKNLTMFLRPVTMTGRIYISKPQSFSWTVDSPVRYRMSIVGDLMKQWDEDANQVQQFSLSRNPGFSPVIGQMRIWFSGVYTPLLEEYTVSVIAAQPAVLEFVPLKESPAASLLRFVRVSFEDGEHYLKEIAIGEINGDTSVIAFSSVVLNMPIDPAAWEAIPDEG